MNRRTFALWALLIGLVIGILGMILFYKKDIGVSFPLYTLIVCGSILFASIPARHRLPWRNLWPLVPVLFFAAMVTVLDSPSVINSNMLAVLTLGGLVLYFLPGDSFIDHSPFTRYCIGLIETGVGVAIGPVAILLNLWNGRQQASSASGSRETAQSIVRGLLLAAPILLVFVVLLGSADAIFADYLDQVVNIFKIEDLEDLFNRVMLTGFLGWLACGAIAFGLARHILVVATRNSASPNGDESRVASHDDPFSLPDSSDSSSATKRQFSLGIIEASIVLGSIDLLFVVFVLIQFAYFFGGRTNISVEGLTYAEYARRGFFELVAVSILTLGLALWLDRVTRRDSRRQHIVFRTLSVMLIALTSVILVSAWQRMALYEQVYGFTHLRIYTHIFMLWLGLLFAFYLLALFRIGQHLFSLGLLLVITGYLVTLNLINPDHLIASRNIERYHAGYELDIRYLRDALSSDATPALIGLYEDTAQQDDLTHQCVGMILKQELVALDAARAGRASTVFSANLSRNRARAQLDAIRDTLPQYDSNFFWENCYYGTGGSISR